MEKNSLIVLGLMSETTDKRKTPWDFLFFNDN